MKIENSTILHLAQFSPSFKGNFIASLEKLANYFKENFNSSFVFCFPHEAKEQIWMKEFVEKYPVYFANANKKQGVIELIQILDKVNPDIVHTHFDGYDIPIIKAIQKRNKKSNISNTQIVWHLHNSLRYQDNLLKRIYQKISFKFHYGTMGDNANLIAVNKSELEFIEKWRKKSLNKKSIVIQNGVDESRIKFINNSQAHETFTFGAIGGRNVQKRIDLLLSAGNLLSSQNVSFKIVILKGTDTEDVVSDFFAESFPNWLVIMESTNDMQQFYEICDCFVSCSEFETFSYALAEATFAGLPIIQSDIEGTSWNLVNPSSFSFKSGDYIDLSKVLYEVLNKDYKLLKQLAKETRQNNINNFGINKWCQQIAYFYSQI